MFLKSNKHIIKSDTDLIIDHLLDDTSLQTYAMKEAITGLHDNFPTSDQITIVDLGCGTGDSFDKFKDVRPNINWVGLDIEDSPEVGMRARNDLSFQTYDGIHLPFPDNSIDFIYTHQVFEHVRHPEKLLQEVCRVLKSSGQFIGSTSCLEPYHSYSLWNYTPHGFITILSNAGFKSISIKPGIDGLTLILRRILSYIKLGWLLKPFFTHESPLNLLIEIVTRVLLKDSKKRTAMKLTFSGHFIFISSKR